MRELIYIDKNCDYCGAHFNKGPKRKRFCNRKCRSKFHNAIYRDPESPKNIVQKARDKNEKILQKIAWADPVIWDKIPKAILVYEGYDFSVTARRVINPRTGRGVYVNDYSGLELNDDRETYCLHLVSSEGKLIYL